MVYRKAGNAMSRIISACLLQTMKFDTAHDADPGKEFEMYCSKLDRQGVRYVIEENKLQDDGSIVVKIRKQYNAYKTEGYLD